MHLLSMQMMMLPLLLLEALAAPAPPQLSACQEKRADGTWGPCTGSGLSGELRTDYSNGQYKRKMQMLSNQYNRSLETNLYRKTGGAKMVPDTDSGDELVLDASHGGGFVVRSRLPNGLVDTGVTATMLDGDAEAVAAVPRAPTLSPMRPRPLALPQLPPVHPAWGWGMMALPQQQLMSTTQGQLLAPISWHTAASAAPPLQLFYRPPIAAAPLPAVPASMPLPPAVAQAQAHPAGAAEAQARNFLALLAASVAPVAAVPPLAASHGVSKSTPTALQGMHYYETPSAAAPLPPAPLHVLLQATVGGPAGPPPAGVPLQSAEGSGSVASAVADRSLARSTAPAVPASTVQMLAMPQVKEKERDPIEGIDAVTTFYSADTPQAYSHPNDGGVPMGGFTTDSMFGFPNHNVFGNNMFIAGQGVDKDYFGMAGGPFGMGTMDAPAGAEAYPVRQSPKEMNAERVMNSNAHAASSSMMNLLAVSPNSTALPTGPSAVSPSGQSVAAA